MTATNLLVGVAILIGLVGIIVPVLPGSILILGAVLVWALELQTGTGWVVFAIAAGLIVTGSVIKFLVPGKRLKATVPNTTLLVGALFAVIGFFVIPVVGLLAGFPLGIYLAERQRLGSEGAWPSTKVALKAVGVSILIELVFGVLAALTWTVGLIVA